MKKYLLAIISGIITMFSFPTVLFGWHAPELGFLAFISLVPLFVAINNVRPRKAFCLAFVTAAICYSGSLYWIYRAMNTYGNLPSVASVAVLVILIIIISAYIAIAPMLSRWVSERSNIPILISLPIFWVICELSRNYIPCNGFPWANLAMSQYSHTTIIQIVDLIGIYGLMFILVWVNQFIAELTIFCKGNQGCVILSKAKNLMKSIVGRGSFVRSSRTQDDNPICTNLLSKSVVTLLILTTVVVYGIWRSNDIQKQLSKLTPVKIAILQGNIPQEEKQDPSMKIEVFNKYRRMLKQATNADIELAIWPETAYPWIVRRDLQFLPEKHLGLSDIGSPFPFNLIGVVAYDDNGGDDRTIYNSVMLTDRNGMILDFYDKTHLVPYGEYVPYKKVLFFLKKLVSAIGTFETGKTLEPLNYGFHRFGNLICYEDIFPEISRKTTLLGAEFLVNTTNDAWYGVSSAPYQHLALSVFRAVENRRYLVRSTNTGISAVIDPIGQINMQSDIFTDALIVSYVGAGNIDSVYTRLGDWFAYGCVLYGLF
ncbi:apolipoprotein N-acyltransferase, partial [bacterium]|nr:apolipoprotein N-acyltransferase [bacterium]